MTFTEVDQRYLELKEQSLAGTLTDEAFDDALRELMVTDEAGRWWAKSREKGEWHFYDAVTASWVRAEPLRDELPEGQDAPEFVEDALAALPPEVEPPVEEDAVDAPTSFASPTESGAPLPRWAARASQLDSQPSVAPEAAAASRSAPGHRPAGSGFGPMPELGGGLKLLFYLLSFFLPLAGFVLFLLYRNKPAPQDKAAARTFLILGVVSLLFPCLCGGVAMVMVS